jgi:D-alanyl-D-alanine dipeptidase
MITPAELLRIAGLRPELRALALPFIADVEHATGKSVSIPPRGALRSYSDQVDLWNARASNPYPVAQPGTSRHEYGAALDVNIAGGTDDDYETAADIATSRYGLDAGLYFSTPDRVHFQLHETLDASCSIRSRTPINYPKVTIC